MSALDTAIRKATGPSKLASAIGVRPNVITNWRLRDNVPEEHCPAIERATGVRCEELRPDVTWTRNEQGQVTGYHVRLAVQGSTEAA